MQNASIHQNPARAIINKAPLLYGAVKFEHTIFALPFAYLGMVLAASLRRTDRPAPASPDQALARPDGQQGRTAG